MSVFDDMTLDHLGVVVDDLDEAGTRYGQSLGLTVRAVGEHAGSRRAALGRGDIRLLLIQPSGSDSASAAYREAHGEGVSEIALGVPDAAAAVTEARRRGARVVADLHRQGELLTATVMGFGDVTHTFVQRPPALDAALLPGLGPVHIAEVVDRGLVGVDHLAVCLEARQLDATVQFYEQVLDFDLIYTEHVEVGAQAMYSSVVRSRSGAVTLTLIEPDTARASGQIDDFLKNHGGAGVQHVAFTSTDIVATVKSMAASGTDFLDAPEFYYRRLGERLQPVAHTLTDLARLSILVDEDDYGQMFQIFARSVHPRRTFFLEIIERLRARTFGSNNIKALYEAVELQRDARAAEGAGNDSNR